MNPSQTFSLVRGHAVTDVTCDRLFSTRFCFYRTLEIFPKDESLLKFPSNLSQVSLTSLDQGKLLVMDTLDS